MEKIVFKNEYLNIVFGALLVILAAVSYFTGFVEEYIPIFIGAALILLSVKRFWFSFKKITSKNATLILIIELILDLVFGGLLIYMQDHILLFSGLVLYIRGVAYLVINYVATRKVKLPQYLFNIGFVTLGTYLVFSSFNIDLIYIVINVVILIIGAIYLQAGIRKLVAKEEIKEKQEKQEKEIIKVTEKKEKEQEKLQKIEAKSDKEIAELKAKVKETEKEHKLVTEQKKELEKKVQKIEPKVEEVKKKEPAISYEKFTLVELKDMAKKSNLTGYSQLNKAELINKLKETKK